jgi:hypothetical protein
VSSQATTRERQSVRLRRLRATDGQFRGDRSDPDEREPGAEEDTLRRTGDVVKAETMQEVRKECEGFA